MTFLQVNFPFLYGMYLSFLHFALTVTYLQSNPGGITIFGWTVDRGLLNTIFFLELSLILFVLGKTIVFTGKNWPTLFIPSTEQKLWPNLRELTFPVKWDRNKQRSQQHTVWSFCLGRKLQIYMLLFYLSRVVEAITGWLFCDWATNNFFFIL